MSLPELPEIEAAEINSSLRLEPTRGSTRSIGARFRTLEYSFRRRKRLRFPELTGLRCEIAQWGVSRKIGSRTPPKKLWFPVWLPFQHQLERGSLKQHPVCMAREALVLQSTNSRKRKTTFGREASHPELDLEARKSFLLRGLSKLLLALYLSKHVACKWLRLSTMG